MKISRWFKAQKYEMGFWDKITRDIIDRNIKQIDWYEWKSKELEKLILKHFNISLNNNDRILEIGTGPIGIINYINGKIRCSIDPLENYYKCNRILVELRNKNILFMQGIGECLPFKKETFDVVIIDNVIDHTNNPDFVLKEIQRVLKKDGLLYLTVNIHTRLGAYLHAILARINIDKGHPHTFTSDRIRELLNINNFIVLKEIVDDYYQIRGSYRKSKNIKGKLKGYSGLSEYQYCSFCRKRT